MQRTRQFTEVFDPEFHFAFDVPTHLVVHVPPTRLNITRLVFCRNYRPHEPTSCAMGDGCKFVHADVDPSTLHPHPIHVNYAYRTLEKCSYARLPAGETLAVMAPNERPPVDEIPSERILVTRGSLMRKEHNGPLSHCAHYYFNRMCNRGERCNFIHSVTVDPTVTSDFKRAPARSTHSQRPAPVADAHPHPHSRTALTATEAVQVIRLASPVAGQVADSDSDGEGSCGCEDVEVCDATLTQVNDFSPRTVLPGNRVCGDHCTCVKGVAEQVKPSVLVGRSRTYRHNPYGATRSAVIVAAG